MAFLAQQSFQLRVHKLLITYIASIHVTELLFLRPLRHRLLFIVPLSLAIETFNVSSLVPNVRFITRNERHEHLLFE